MSARARRAAPPLAFAALCYLPLLATSPGLVVADTKSYLYIDPSRMLSRAWSMWDAHVGLGTVTHQNIGFLWPMGPYYWAMERVGAPDWVAQRLWLGSILFAAGAGMRYLLRTLGVTGHGTAAAVGVYAFTPYVLTIAVRISAILLPFAALPWLVALAIRATRSGGWRHPAAFALIVTTAGTSNATAILLAGLAPATWMVWASLTRSHPIRSLVLAVARIAALTLATSAWWIVGLSVQATHGLDVLRYTESVATTAAASSAIEVLRGLGYWFFYGDDALGPWIGPSRPYQRSPWLLASSYAVPVLGLLAGAVTRWRERSLVVALLLVGMVVAVGVHPYVSPSPVGRLLRGLLESDVGMAMRSLPRATPIVVLALGLMLAAGVGALGRHSPQLHLPATAAVLGLVVLSLPPLWQRTLAPENLRRPEDLPAYWHEVGDHLDATDDGTRVLELPGADFASYRWGTTIDPVTPGLTDRPIVARELVPMGSAPSADLLNALDGRLQANIAEATSLAPVARVLRAGQILVRSDLRYEHYDTPRPKDLRSLVARAPGLGPAVEIGPRSANIAQQPAPMLDELELSSDPTRADPHAVSVVPVRGAPPIATTRSPEAPVVLAGDGEGIVDSAAAGLIDGTELLRYSASLSDEELQDALDAGAALVVTDSNRRRGTRWGTIRFTRGYTEPAGHRPLAPDRTDARLPVFPGTGDDSRTVAVHRGVTANATSYGGRNEYLPEARPANAIDGDPTTAWRAGRDDPVVGERLELRFDRPVSTRTITFLGPPPPVNRWITRVALRFDGGDPVRVDLDARSRSGAGQVVEFSARRFTSLAIEVLADSAGSRKRYGGLTSVGFAEVRIGDRVMDELIRPPVDLLRRAGPRASAHPLAIVLSRLRSAVTDVERADEEPTLARLLELPDHRAFAVAGTARLAPRARDELIDVLVGQDPARATSASSRLAGAGSRASLARDGDTTTAWTAAYGDQAGQWIEVREPRPITLDQLALKVRADGRHSVPTRVGVEADGRQVATVDLPSIRDSDRANATATVAVDLPEVVTASTLRLTILATRSLETSDWSTRLVRTLPVSIAELGVPALIVPTPRGELPSSCRDDLLTVAGEPVRITVSGTIEEALAGRSLAISACDGAPLILGGGAHEVRSAKGAQTGIDVDRLVLRSGPGGVPPTTTGTLRGVALDGQATPAPRVTVVGSGADRLRLRISGARAGEAFWLSFGQSWSTGWRASIGGTDLGPPVLVDGFANGWLITPEASELAVSLRFAPQGRVNLALWFSAVAALVCLVLAVRRPAAALADPAANEGPALVDVRKESQPLPRSTSAGVALGAAVLGTVVANPVVGLLAGVLALVRARTLVPARVALLASPFALALGALYVVTTVARNAIAPGLDWPVELGRAHPIAWFAVVALVVEASISALRRRERR